MTTRYERLIPFLLHIQCLASSKHFYFFQKQIWDSVHGLFFHGVSSINCNESINTFQVSHQTAFSNWARSECVTYVQKVSSPITCALNYRSLSASAHTASQKSNYWLISQGRVLGSLKPSFHNGCMQNLYAQTPTRSLQSTLTGSISIHCTEAHAKECVQVPDLTGEQLRYYLIKLRFYFFFPQKLTFLFLSNFYQLRFLTGLADAIHVSSSHTEFVLPVSLQVLHVERGAAAGSEICPFVIH